MAEEPSLPCLPAVSWDEQSQSFSNQPRKRARNLRGRRASPQIFDSSDPAVFSSDDDPGLDNYVEGRRKRRYVGSWFQQQPTSPDPVPDELPTQTLPGSRRTLTRQIDSGIYLGSDLTDGDNDDRSMMFVQASPVSRLPLLQKRAVPRVSPAEVLARERIQDCLDRSHEAINLWSIGLEEVSSETISRLAQFTCVPVVVKDVVFEQRDPQLQLILSSNALRSLPGALFDLTHLTVLSLRGNQLTELPPSVCKLANLRQLNLSQNRLQSLPAELINLLRPGAKLWDLALHPNPFTQPEQLFAIREDEFYGFDAAAPFVDFRTSLPNLDKTPMLPTWHRGRSPLQISNSRGTILSRFQLPPTGSSEAHRIEAFQGGDDDDDDGSKVVLSRSSSARRDDTRPSAVPSLLETALRACHRTRHLGDLESYIPDSFPHLASLIRRTVQQRDGGGLACSRCRRMIVVPVMQWIEWREIRTSRLKQESGERVLCVGHYSNDRSEAVVPFLHRACSWQCGPRRDEHDYVFGVLEAPQGDAVMTHASNTV